MARLRRLAAVVAAVSTASTLGVGHARAGGYGIYLESEVSDAAIAGQVPFNASKVVRDFRSVMGGFGVAYDTNLARDEALNYRFKIGYRYGKRTWDRRRPVTFPRRVDQQDSAAQPIVIRPKPKSAQGFTFNQTLGYGFIRNPSYRIWAGPTTRLNVDWYGVATDLDIVDVAVGGGPELGINYHLAQSLSLAASLSYNFLYLAEHFDTAGGNRRFEGSQHLLALTVSLFFRSESDRWHD